MNELTDYRRAIGTFLPSRGPRGRRKWQPSCKPKLSTTELLTIALVGLLWISAVYISIDINLQLLKDSPPVPVSTLFAYLHSVPCHLKEKLGSSELWGRGGLSGLYEAHMGVENWQNRLTWSLASYGVHKLFLALKLLKSGDIELNPGPNPAQSDKASDRTPREHTRRATRAKTRGEAEASQLGRLAQVEESQTLGVSVGTPSGSGTSVSRTHLTPVEGRQSRYQTPISQEIEEAKLLAQGVGNQHKHKNMERVGLVTSTPKKNLEGDEEGSEREVQSTQECKKRGSKEMNEEHISHSGNGEPVSETETVQPEGLVESDGQEAAEEEGEGSEEDINRSLTAENSPNLIDEEHIRNSTPQTQAQQGLFTSERENPEETVDRAEGGDESEVTTTTTTAYPVTTTTESAASMNDVTAQWTRPQEGGDERTWRSNTTKGKTSTPFSHFPGHTCEFDNKNNDSGSGTHPTQVTGMVPREDEEVVLTHKSATTSRPSTHRSSHEGTGLSKHNIGSGLEMEYSVEASSRRKAGASASMYASTSADVDESMSHVRGNDGRERGRRNGNSHSDHSQSSHAYSHANKQHYMHAHSQDHYSAPNQSLKHPHSHSHGYPDSHQSHHMQSFQQQMQQQPQAQYQPQPQYQQSRHTYPPHRGRGGYRERDKVSNPGYLNTGIVTQSCDAMNEYHSEWEERDHNQQELSMANALGLIMSKMEVQQGELQKQMQRNQAITERGIDNTQKRISHMHRDIQNIQQEVRETNLEVQQNKEEIRQLQERQGKLEQQQDSALSKTQNELEKAQEEIRQMRQSLEQMDEAIEARDEEMEEIQDELMEARQNLNRVEAHNRRGNLKIFGISEHQGDDKEKCDEVAMKLFTKYMPGQDWDTDQVERAHRLGKYKEGGRGRPILVKMANPQDTFYILGNRPVREKMKKDNIHISQDLTRDQQDILKQEKDKGNLAYFVAGKLVIREGEGKFYNRDSSRGRRRDRGRDSVRDRDSESGSYRGKRNRQGSAISRNQSRDDSGSGTRTHQEPDHASPQRPARPWRFGSTYRSSPRRNRNEDQTDKDGNTFKVPEGPAYRPTRPAHRNPYRYLSRSASRQTRNSSPARSRKSSPQGKHTTKGQNSGASSPSTSPTNSPTASRTSSRQSSRSPSRHPNRGAKTNQGSSNPNEKGEESPQQQQQLEIGDRLKQLSEETPSKQKPASQRMSPHSKTNWQPPKAKGKGRDQVKQPALPLSPPGLATSQPSYQTTGELQEKQSCTTSGAVSNPIQLDSDSDSTSPGSKQPSKKQRRTVRRFGSNSDRAGEESNIRSNSLNSQDQMGHRPRPRARIYSGRRFRSQTWRKQETTKGQGNPSASHSSPDTAQPQTKGKTPVKHKEKEERELKLGKLSCSTPITLTQESTKKDGEKGLQPNSDKATDYGLMESGHTTDQRDPAKPSQSHVQEVEMLSPAACETSQQEPQSSMDTLDTSPPSPKTPQDNNPDKPTGRKQGSWGERERTKQMRSSLEKENEGASKQGGAIAWKMIEDGPEQHSKDCNGLHTNGKAKKVDKDNNQRNHGNSQRPVDNTQEDKEDLTYSSIWDPPTPPGLTNSGKEGCSPNKVPSEKGGESNSGGRLSEAKRSKEANSATTISDPQENNNIGTDEEGWQSVKYKKTFRKEQKKQSQTAETAPPEPGTSPQERGRKKAKKKNINGKKGEQKDKGLETREEGAKAKAKAKGNQASKSTESKQGTGTGTEQITLQERVNIAIATAASREDSRSQSASRQAYLTPEGAVVRNLQPNPEKARGGVGAKQKQKTKQ